MWKPIATLVVAAVCAVPTLCGQAFEAASVKPSQPDDPRRPAMEFLPGGRFRAIGMPLIAILGTAYNVPWQSADAMRIKGLPDWVLAEKYDIEATSSKPSAPPAAGARSRNETIRLMLQAVLADRFKLRMRRESVEMPVHALTVASHGPALEKSKVAEKDCTESGPFGGTACHQLQGGVGRGIRGEAVDMADIALYVSNWSDIPVIDQTGLTGMYPVQIDGWDTRYTHDPSRPSLSEVFERLGLRLVDRKAPVDTYVIEHIEKPSAN